MGSRLLLTLFFPTSKEKAGAERESPGAGESRGRQPPAPGFGEKWGLRGGLGRTGLTAGLGAMALGPVMGLGEQSWPRGEAGGQPLLQPRHPALPWLPASVLGFCSQAAPCARGRSPSAGRERAASPSKGWKAG